MTVTTEQAKNEMYGAVRDVMVAQFPTMVRKWDGVDSHEPPGNDVSWIYAAIRHALGRQASLAGDTGVRRWRRTGSMTVQCFVPLNNAGAVSAMTVAAALQAAIQKLQTTGGVWFRDATAMEIGPTNAFYQANFRVFFEYDQIQ